jgi:hypothetical protein
MGQAQTIKNEPADKFTQDPAQLRAEEIKTLEQLLYYLNKAPKSELIISDWVKAPIFLQIMKGKSEVDSVFVSLPDKLKDKMKYYG